MYRTDRKLKAVGGRKETERLGKVQSGQRKEWEERSDQRLGYRNERRRGREGEQTPTAGARGQRATGRGVWRKKTNEALHKTTCRMKYAAKSGCVRVVCVVVDFAASFRLPRPSPHLPASCVRQSVSASVVARGAAAHIFLLVQLPSAACAPRPHRPSDDLQADLFYKSMYIRDQQPNAHDTTSTKERMVYARRTRTNTEEGRKGHL
ncbi:hypothetical protein C8Q78DRAFT_14279 [Trametes maxima]|nr:hypothetical protein C8Q78DRAFT_14279 [Trametes maxima]